MSEAPASTAPRQPRQPRQPSLLGAVLRGILCGPSLREEFRETTERPAALELVDDVDEIALGVEAVVAEPGGARLGLERAAANHGARAGTSVSGRADALTSARRHRAKLDVEV